MQSFKYVDGMFVDAAVLNADVNANTTSLQNILQGIFTPGLLKPAALQYTFNNSLVVGLVSPSSFQLLNSAGQEGIATGVANNATTTSYSLNFASLLPGSGTVTAYVVASIIQISQNPVTVVGPPKGHPDYNPANGPLIAYTIQQNSIAFTTTTTAPDNITYFEVARVSLSAGQTAVTSLDTSNQYLSRPMQAVIPFAGNPNGSISGIAASPSTGVQPSVIWDTRDNMLWVCTTSGTSNSAIWAGLANVSQLVQYGGANGNIESVDIMTASCSATFTPNRNGLIRLSANAANSNGVITSFVLSGTGFTKAFQATAGAATFSDIYTDEVLLTCTAGVPVTITYTLTIPSLQAGCIFGFVYTCTPLS